MNENKGDTQQDLSARDSQTQREERAREAARQLLEAQNLLRVDLEAQKSFARNSSTGSPTLKEHTEIVKREIARLGF